MEHSENNFEFEINHLKQELSYLQQKYQVLSETIFEGVYILENGYCIESNQMGCELLGYNHDEIIGMYSVDIVVPEDKEIAESRLANPLDEPFETTLIRKDGSQFHALVRAKSHIYKDKHVRIVAIRDISDYKISIDNLLESENKYKAVVENAGDGIIIGNKQGEIIEANNAFYTMTGYNKEEIINKHISFLFTSDSIEYKPLRFDLVNMGHTVIYERTIVGKNGEMIPVEMNSKKPSDNYYLSVIRDLRERKKAEEDLRKSNKELREAKERAEESDRLKSSFLTNMSHEIRTPMNGIIGFAELIKNQTLTPELREDYINVILSSGQQLMNIINDVLEISKIETGHIKVESVPFDILSLLKEIVSFFKPVAERGHNELTINTSRCNLALLSGDPAKIQQVLTNLINNSLKFTENGKVEVGIITRSVEIIFYVKDTGIGIPEQYINSIFDRFTQAQHDGINKQKGTGLGLSICKKLVKIMDGDIWVESEVGKGSTFYFEIPFMPM